MGSRRGLRRGVAPTALVLVLVLNGARPCVPLAAETPAPDPALGRILGNYMDDPRANRRPLLDLAAQGTDALPPAALLALADALLRAHQMRAAAERLTQVVARDADAETVGWARVGLGWIALARGDLDTARTQYELVATGNWGNVLGAAVLALIAASEGQGPDAASLLDQLAVSGEASSSLRLVSRLGAAYARYWNGDFREASSAFHLAAVEYPDGVLADDARYGAAWARYRSGEVDRAIAELRGLAGDDSNDLGGRLPRALVNLQPRAVFHQGLQRYGRAPVGNVEGQLLAVLDLDGAALARSALKQIHTKAGEAGAEEAGAAVVLHGGSLPAAATDSAPPVDGSPPLPTASVGRQLGDTSPTGAESTPPAPSSRTSWLWLGLVMVVGAAGLAARRLRVASYSGRRGDLASPSRRTS